MSAASTPVHPTAEPFYADAGPGPDGRRIGVLLSHGFTGSPASMKPWGEFLLEKGYSVAVPRLPGHGTRWQDLGATTFSDWYGEVERAFEKLRSDCDEVVVAGLSMGGSLVLKLAAEKGREVSGIMLVNPAVNTTRKDVKLLPVLKHVIPAFPGIGDDIKKEGVTEHGYAKTPLKAVDSLMQSWKQLRPRLPEVTQPLLLFRSRVDHVVDPSSARIILTTVSSRDLEERVLEDSYHVATLDNDAPSIFAVSADFVRRVTTP